MVSVPPAKVASLPAGPQSSSPKVQKPPSARGYFGRLPCRGEARLSTAVFAAGRGNTYPTSPQSQNFLLVPPPGARPSPAGKVNF